MNIRKAVRADTTRIAEIHVRSWQAAYKDLLPEDFLSTLDIHKREKMWNSCLEENGQLFVVEDSDSKIIGFLHLNESTEQDLREATELTAIYLDPEYYGSGVGTVFYKRIEENVHTDYLYLWVLSTNRIGIAFYEKNGFEPDGKRKAFEMDGQTFEEFRYRKLCRTSREGQR